VNERIREVHGSFTVGAAPGGIHVFCECGQSGCLERVEVPAAVYEDIRDQDDHFLVSQGHEDRERVLHEGETYRIVVLGEPERNSHGGRPVRFEPETILTEPS
jgi:hypothetical protein